MDSYFVRQHVDNGEYMSFRWYLFLLCLVFCLSQEGFAKKTTKKSKRKTTQVTRHVRYTPPPIIYGSDQLAATISSLIINSNVKADIGVYVKSMSGQALYSRNISRSLTPASTMKILTAEAALIYLGPQYRFSTQLLTNASGVKNGVLQGDLYVVLSGDPTLTYPDLLELMESLKAAQINSISGQVYIDNTAYDQSFYGPGWIWEDKGYCYAAPISASIINHNCLSFQVAPSKKPGAPANVIKSSKYFYPKINNSVTTKSYRSRACALRLSRDSSSSISIDGCLSKNRVPYGVSYVVTDIPEYNRALFKSVLSQLGVKVYGSVTFGTAPRDLSMVGSHQSEPLKKLVRDMLKKSDNIIAGALFKKLGQLYSRQPGSWENGSVAVSQILSKRANMSTSGLRVLDGSGLSPDNLATPQQMMQVLDFAFHNAATSEEFMSALPIAGVDGTLKHRMGNIARKVRAKTGTISGVVSLAGYAQSADKEALGFVIMINGSRGMGWRYKTLEDKIVTALTRYKRG